MMERFDNVIDAASAFNGRRREAATIEQDQEAVMGKLILMRARGESYVGKKQSLNTTDARRLAQAAQPLFDRGDERALRFLVTYGSNSLTNAASIQERETIDNALFEYVDLHGKLNTPA